MPSLFENGDEASPSEAAARLKALEVTGFPGNFEHGDPGSTRNLHIESKKFTGPAKRFLGGPCCFNHKAAFWPRKTGWGVEKAGLSFEHSPFGAE